MGPRPSPCRGTDGKTASLLPYNAPMSGTTRIGYGEDSHRLVSGRPLLVGGVAIDDSPVGSDAHSDGDVLLHALADAMLSAYALGDIGRYFPPDDPKFRDIAGQEIVRAVLARIRRVAGRLSVNNVAAVVTLDQPKLGPRREAIERRLASLLGLEPGRVGVTFKTSEGLAPGHIQARVTVLLSSA
jgi:2-C-methyl-D-erythritol 2,4-cyclodiphosphate synthase